MAVTLQKRGSRWQITAPYNADFVIAAHAIEGRWRKRSQLWSFPNYRYVEAVKACNKVYGTKFKIRQEEV